jgi:hypothetical protein
MAIQKQPPHAAAAGIGAPIARLLQAIEVREDFW